MVPTILAVSLVLSLVICVQAAWQEMLFACPNFIWSDNLQYDLVRGVVFGLYVQCDYLHDFGGGVSAGSYCFYYSGNHSITHYPNTPIRADSNPNCPDTLPTAQTYLIKESRDGNKCVTSTGITDGSKVQIQDCNPGNDYKNQLWWFSGSLVRLVGYRVSQCLDVKDGVVANGAKLQTWSCGDWNNQNQQFAHLGGDFLTVPDDVITWMAHPWLCMDLTAGDTTNGNRIQLWGCDPAHPNPNQQWFLQPILR